MSVNELTHRFGLTVRSRVDTLIAEDLASGQRRRCTFASRDTPTESDLVDLSEVLEDAVLQMRPEMPLELVVSTFQKLVRTLPCTTGAKLTAFAELAPYSVLARGRSFGYGHEDRHRASLQGTVSLHGCAIREGLVIPLCDRA